MSVSKSGLAKRLAALAIVILIMLAMSMPAFAATGSEGSSGTEVSEEAESSVSGTKAMAAAGCVCLVAVAGAIGMSFAVSKAEESVARQPEAAGDIRGSMMLGLVFMETAIIYALIVAILIIFVL